MKLTNCAPVPGLLGGQLVAGPDLADVAQTVAMLERAVENPGDDLHVGMRVLSEPTTPANDVVVVHEQEAVMRVLRIMEAAEAERMPRIEPIDLGVEALACAAHVDGHPVSI